MKRKRGRPTLYTEAVADELCRRLSEGEPLRQICRDDHMPGWTAVYDWMGKSEEFSERIARARVLGQDAIAEQCLDISDSVHEDPASRRVRVDTRLKLLAKWNPKRYGDQVRAEISGPDGGAIQIDDTARAARVAQLLALAEKRRRDEEGEAPA